MSSILAEAIRDADLGREAVEKLDALVGRKNSLDSPDSQGVPETPPKPYFRVVPLDDLMTAAPKPHGYVAFPILPEREVTLLSAHGGSGKGTLALALAAHVACARQWGPYRPSMMPRQVLYVSLEDEADTVRLRLRRIIDTYSLPAATVINNFSVLDRSTGDAVLATEAWDEITRTKRLRTDTAGMAALQQAARGKDLVVIDNASDCFDGDENSRRQVRTFVRSVRDIARTNDSAILLLAHVDKLAARSGGGGNTFSGSTAWHNSCRSRLALFEENEALTLAHEKCQYAKKADPVTVMFDDSAVLVPIGAADVTAHADAQTQGDAEIVLAAIGSLITDHMSVPTSNSGGSTAWHVLSTILAVRNLGKDRVKSALLTLERSGRIVRESYRVNRKPRERFVAAPIPAPMQVGTDPVTAPTDPSKSAPVYTPIPPTCIGADRGTAPMAGNGIGAALPHIGALAHPIQPTESSTESPPVDNRPLPDWFTGRKDRGEL